MRDTHSCVFPGTGAVRESVPPLPSVHDGQRRGLAVGDDASEHLAGLRPRPERLRVPVGHKHYTNTVAVGENQAHLTDGAETLEDSRVMRHEVQANLSRRQRPIGGRKRAGDAPAKAVR